jgi:hypothetical protein
MKGHRYFTQWDNLPDAQDNVKNDRHKCAGCAYVEGIKDALNHRSMSPQLNPAIPDSQAGTVRHKDAYEAYKLGYQEGQLIDS